MTTDESADGADGPTAAGADDPATRSDGPKTDGADDAGRSRGTTDARDDQPGDRDAGAVTGASGSSADASGSDADSETFRAFWGAVLAVDVGLFCVVVGPVFAYARGRTALGGLVFVVGLVALYRAYARYRDYVDDDGGDEGPGDDVSHGDGGVVGRGDDGIGEPDDAGVGGPDEEEVGA